MNGEDDKQDKSKDGDGTDDGPAKQASAEPGLSDGRPKFAISLKPEKDSVAQPAFLPKRVARPVAPERLGETPSLRQLIDGGMGARPGGVGAKSKTFGDLAMGQSRLNQMLGGPDRSVVGRALADINRTLGATGGIDSLAQQIAGTSAAIEAAGGIDAIMGRHYSFERSIASLGGIGAMIGRHSAMASTIEAMGGVGAIMKRHEALLSNLGVAALASGRANPLADLSLGRASNQLDQVLRELSGITAFTGLAGSGVFDHHRLEAMISGVQSWRAGDHRFSLESSLHARLPDLFPERRRASVADLSGMHLGPLGERFGRDRSRLRAIEEEMLRIRRPWVDADDPHRSASAYIEARALAEIVETSPAESRAVVVAVRSELGDYRDTVPVSEFVVSDPFLRSAFRIEVGFNPDLSSLPPAILAAIFNQVAGGKQRPVEIDPDALASLVHQRVRRLELKLRRFIERRMIVVAGRKWSKQRVHGETIKKWRERRELDVINGRTPSRLFDYAGFEDYRAIIDQNNNWDDAFATVFKVRTAVLESLRRLSLIRNPDAHFRVVTIDDFLDLVVEERRFDQWLNATN